MNGYNREVDPHPRHGYGIDVEGLSWLISSISTSDKALERKKELLIRGNFCPLL